MTDGNKLPARLQADCRIKNFQGRQNILGRNGSDTTKLSDALDEYILDARAVGRDNSDIRDYVAEAVLRWAEK